MDCTTISYDNLSPSNNPHDLVTWLKQLVIFKIFDYFLLTLKKHNFAKNKK